jgi:hypothetical protein
MRSNGPLANKEVAIGGHGWPWVARSSGVAESGRLVRRMRPTGSSGAVSATAPSPWSRERSPALAGRARGFLASGSGRWTLPQLREQAMARADPTRAGLTVRCAIYTRKSSDEGLEQEFNSLDAQREARELARRLQGTGVTANCLHPGFVAAAFRNHCDASASSLVTPRPSAYARPRLNCASASPCSAALRYHFTASVSSGGTTWVRSPNLSLCSGRWQSP